MDSKLREEVKNHLDLCKRVGHDSKDTKLLQRCLSEFDKSRWRDLQETGYPPYGKYLWEEAEGGHECYFADVAEAINDNNPGSLVKWKPID